MSGFRGGVTGESISSPLKVGFDRRLKLQFHGAKLSSEGGLIVFRELDDALGLTEMASWELRDNRTGKNSRHNLLAMMTDRRSILADEFRASRAAICHVFTWTKRSRFPEFRAGNTLGLATALNAFERDLETRIKLGKDTHIDMSSGGYRLNRLEKIIDF